MVGRFPEGNRTSIRTDDFLYIHNFKPDRWPAGHPDGSYHGKIFMDIDASPTKDYIGDHKNEADMEIYWQLSCGLRPADELYDVRLDPYQMHNVADRKEYSDTLERLKAQLFRELKASEDPRLLGGGDAFDSYEYLGRLARKPE